MSRILWILLLAIPLVAREKIPLSITVSGGVSLGSYQAGYHYVANDWLRINREHFKVLAVTGASAGAINALLTVLSLADTSFVVDTQSVFYRAWIPVGYDRLKGGKSALGVFTRKFFDTLRDRVIAPELTSPQAGDTLDIILGVTATRINASTIKLKDNFNIPNVEDKFLVRMTRRGSGPWELLNYVDPGWRNPVPILPLRIDRKKDIETVTRLVYASSGFPGAFEPLSIQQWRVVPHDLKNVTWDTGDVSLWKQMCALPENEVPGIDSSPNYIDGGVFDNAPLRLASNLICNGITKEGDEICIKKIPEWQANNDVFERVRFLYFSQDNIVFPQKRPSEKERLRSITLTLGNVAGNLVSSARAKELNIINDRFPAFSDQLKLTKSYAPTMSAYLVNFLGFFEKPFRTFDFYLGMYDAHRYFNDFALEMKQQAPEVHSTIQATGPDSDVRYKLTEKTLDAVYTALDSCAKDRSFKPDHEYWKPVIDLVNIWYEQNTKIASCGGAAFRQHAAMLQSSIDRLWARWMLYHSDSTQWSAGGGNSKPWKRMLAYRPTFFNLTSIQDNDFENRVLKHLSSEASGKVFSKGEFDALLFLLDKYEYVYQDLFKNRTASPENAKTAIADNFTALLKSLAKNQKNGIEKMGYGYVARPVSNLFNYSAPKRIFRLGAGTDGVTFGYAQRIGRRYSWIERVKADCYLTASKGSKANIGADGNHKLRQFYTPFLFGGGLLIDIFPWNAWWQMKVGTSCSIGKDWMLNSTFEDLSSDWTLGYTRFTLQGSFMDILYARLNIGGQKKYDFHTKESGKWDWTRYSLQVGVQWIR